MIKEAADTRERERALYLYDTALLQGDFDAVAAVLKAAEGDAVLERMIKELDREHEEERVRAPGLARDTETVRRLLREHLRGQEPPAAEGAAEVAELTVGDVVARLYADRAVPKIDQLAGRRLQDCAVQVPTALSARAVEGLARQLEAATGVVLSERFWRAFRETALLLGVRASQQLGRAAARRQLGSRGPGSRPGMKKDEHSGGAGG